MARVRSINRATKDIGHDDGFGNLIIDYTNVTGWAVDMDESVIWDELCSNPNGPALVRYVRCKPFTTGPWQTIEFIDTPVKAGSPSATPSFKPDNEDQFYFAQYKDAGGNWVTMDGSPERSGQQLTNNDNAFNLTWNTPQSIIITVVAP